MNGLGFSHEEALQELDSIENLLTLLPDIPAITRCGSGSSRTTTSKASRFMMRVWSPS